jgi:pyruvate kinase
MVNHESNLSELIARLADLRTELLRFESNSQHYLDGLTERHLPSARNLLHYLALRRHDVRDLQDQLAALGLSSLGRAEGCVLATLDSVLSVLQPMAHTTQIGSERKDRLLGYFEGKAVLHEGTEKLLGPSVPGRSVRIMITMPSEAADDFHLIRDLLAGGMDCMRINCAHDDTNAWSRMIVHLRRAERELGRSCRVLMDLPGPKLRTGTVESGPRVLKWRPRRDCAGRVLAPARIWLTATDHPQPPPTPADACLPVPRNCLLRLAVGDRLRFRDARGAARSMTMVDIANGYWAECAQTAYVATGNVLRRCRPGGAQDEAIVEAVVGDLPPVSVPIVLKAGDALLLTRDPAPGRPAMHDAQGRLLQAAHVSCTLPEVFADLQIGERVWLDDGKIGGVIEQVGPDQVLLRITRAAAKGVKLSSDKGINLPDSALRLPALTPQDLEHLPFIAAHADMVGLSFVHSPRDVADLQAELARLGGDQIGIVLKIETRRGFEELPQVLLAAMRSPVIGVMIARGDLAVECGYERLAELQEEILWVCESAHVPVIWATQVLENLAKDGMPSRAEITDAAMGERAECVMLNKGPYIRETVRLLDDILRRMEGHQSKKRAMLRSLKLANRFPEKEMVPAIHSS